MKTEKEKMLNGELYKSWDPQLVEERKQARLLFERYNKTSVIEKELRKQILSQLIGKMGENILIEPPFYCDYGKNISLGDNVFMNFNCVLLDVNRIIIGDNTMIANNVQIITATHPIDATERIKGPEMGYPITIGENVWFGSSVIVLPGVSIGDNTTIGAGSVVTKDIPANVVAVGNPCKVIRKLD